MKARIAAGALMAAIACAGSLAVAYGGEPDSPAPAVYRGCPPPGTHLNPEWWTWAKRRTRFERCSDCAIRPGLMKKLRWLTAAALCAKS